MPRNKRTTAKQWLFACRVIAKHPALVAGRDNEQPSPLTYVGVRLAPEGGRLAPRRRLCPGWPVSLAAVTTRTPQHYLVTPLT
jgi:hypothetical protein